MVRGIGKVEQAILDSLYDMPDNVRWILDRARKRLEVGDTPSSRVMFSRAIKSLRRKGLVVAEPKGGHVQRLSKPRRKEKTLREYTEEAWRLSSRLSTLLGENLKGVKLTSGMELSLIFLRDAINEYFKDKQEQ